MGDHREVRHEHLYLKEPNTERLRKSAAGRLRYLLSNGWRETERWHAPQYLTVRLERSGFVPRMTKLPKPPPAPVRTPRDRSQRGPGGPRSRG